MMTTASLVRYLKTHGCRHTEGHVKAVLMRGKPLDCDKAGRVLWFLRRVQ